MSAPNQPEPSAVEIADWLREKIADAEKSLRIRLEMAATCRSGNQATWEKVAAMHPLTRGRVSTKAERMKEAEGHDRIAIKCRREVVMFKAVAFANAELRGFMEEFPMKVVALTPAPPLVLTPLKQAAPPSKSAGARYPTHPRKSPLPASLGPRSTG